MYTNAYPLFKVKLGEKPAGRPAIIPLILTPSLNLSPSKSLIIILSLPIPKRLAACLAGSRVPTVVISPNPSSPSGFSNWPPNWGQSDLCARYGCSREESIRPRYPSVM